MLRTLIGIVFAACVAAASAVAQTTAVPDAHTIARAELARQYVEIGGSDDLFIAGAAYGFRESARANGVEFNPAQWRAVRLLIEEHYSEAAEMFATDLTNFYTQHATADDLQAAIAYYQTPPGQHYLAVAIERSFPLVSHFASNGAVPLPPLPAPESLDAARLELGRQLAELMAARMHEQERLVVDLTALGVAGVKDYWARSFAAELEAAELEAAIAWAGSPQSLRLEGPSAERSLTIQTTMLRAMQTVDTNALVTSVREILAQSPT